MHLNSNQREAIQYTSGHMLVLAGAGSGKTRVITEKMVYLIENKGYRPEQIYAITFTNKAAKEMLMRIKTMLNSRDMRGLSICTFHTLGLNILRQEYAHLGYKKGFSLLDNTDTNAVLKGLLREDNHSSNCDDNAFKWEISQLKNALVLPSEALKLARNDHELSVAKLYGRYQRQLAAYNAVDFDDLILQPVYLFQQNQEVLMRHQARVQHLLVDEYQDTNSSQYHLIKLLLGHRGKLTAVGDDNQSIYTWRGARPENISDLHKDYPSIKVVKLEQNYRSLARILKCANTLIDHNPHTFKRQLWSDLGIGDKVHILSCSTAEDEAERVVNEIVHRKLHSRAQYSDFAILYRSNHQSRLFESGLRLYNIPYQMSGGTSFFDRAEIKDILAYLRLLINPSDDAALLRIINTPRREIGAATLEKLSGYAQQRNTSLLLACDELGLTHVLSQAAVLRLRRFSDWVNEMRLSIDTRTVAETIDTILSDIDYEAWLQDNSQNKEQAKRKSAHIHEFRDWITQMAKRHEQENDETLPLETLVAKITLMETIERQDQTKDQTNDAVNLSTLHAAKGLEFGHVFLVGVEEELLPHHTSIAEDNIEEERRLCYVGITRAQRTLTLTYANHRKRGGELMSCEPSRFLQELPSEEIHWEGRSENEAQITPQQAGAHFDMMRQLLNK